jgi:hypothetical protein
MDERLGFIVIQRKAVDSYLWDMPPGQFKVAITLLLLANWKQSTAWRGAEKISVERGVVLASRDGLAKISKVSVQTVRTSLKNLEIAGFLTRESTNHHTCLNILNYDKYQDIDYNDRPGDQPAPNQRPTSAQPAPNQPLTTSEPCNQVTKEPGNQSKQRAKRSRTVSKTDLPEVNFVLEDALGQLSDNAAMGRDLIAALVGARKRGLSASVTERTVTRLIGFHGKNPDALAYALGVVLDKGDFDWSRPADNAIAFVERCMESHRPGSSSARRRTNPTADANQRGVLSRGQNSVRNQSP